MNNRLSYSSVEQYLNCPKSWYLKYIRNMKEKYTGSALIFGSALDKALNKLLEGNTTSINLTYLDSMTFSEVNGELLDLRVTDLIQYGNQDFDVDVLTQQERQELELYTMQWDLKKHHENLVQLKREKNLNGEALRHFNYMSWMSLRRKGLLILGAYKEQVLPQIKRIVSVQKEFSLKNDEGDEFIGFIDFIAEFDDKVVIFDNKTTSSAYKDDSARTSKQLASYLGALEELKFDFGTKDIHVGYIAINKNIRKKKEPRVNIQIIIDKVPEDLINSVFEDYDKANVAIHNGEFEPSYPNCASKYGKCFCQSELVHVPKVNK